MSKWGNWSQGKDYGAIVSDQPTGHDDHRNFMAYGGFLVCESIPKRMQPILLAAPDLYDACCLMMTAFLKYGTQIEDLFGHDEEFNKALASMALAVNKVDGID